MSSFDPSAWKKLGNVISPETIPGRIINFSGDAEPSASGTGDTWRLWFDIEENGGRNICFADGPVREPAAMRRTRAVLSSGPADTSAPFSVGNLPDGWNPRQPQHLRLRDGTHRIYFWTRYPGVVRYLAADSADGRHYTVHNPHRACFYHPHDRAVAANAVPDGLTFDGNLHASRPANEPAALPHEVINDATTVYQLPDGTFEAYTAVIEPMPGGKNDPGYVACDNAVGYRRLIRRFTSADGLTWNGPAGEIRPDASDPADLQFYYLTVTHTPRGRVGLLGHYRCAAQTIDVELCFSDDGIHWRRPWRTTPWLPRGREGESDCCIIMPGRSLVRHDNAWWLFYSGYNFLHNHTRSFGGPEASHLMCASILEIPFLRIMS
jgi:hypothetical protein